jgi:surface protein
MDDPPPTAKRQKTTTMAAENEPISIRSEERSGSTAKDDDRTVVMDLLRSLPANIVANYIYPFAVKVIQNHEELIEAVDEYLDEFYSNDDGVVDDGPADAESWSDEEDEEDEEYGEETSSDDEEMEEQDASSTLLDDLISLGSSHQHSNMAPCGSNDEPQDDGKGSAAATVHSRCVHYPIGDWDVSRVDNFTDVFDCMWNYKARHFNEDLSQWNVANGTTFAHMFLGCGSFNSDLSNWNTGHATNLRDMFHGCTELQSDVSRWNMANATDLNAMFHGCSSFNSDVSDWNVANATELGYMFRCCTNFNSDLS